MGNVIFIDPSPAIVSPFSLYYQCNCLLSRSLLYYRKDLLLCLHFFLLLHFTLLRFLDVFPALFSHYSLRLSMMFLTIYKSYFRNFSKTFLIESWTNSSFSSPRA